MKNKSIYFPQNHISFDQLNPYLQTSQQNLYQNSKEEASNISSIHQNSVSTLFGSKEENDEKSNNSSIIFQQNSKEENDENPNNSSIIYQNLCEDDVFCK